MHISQTFTPSAQPVQPPEDMSDPLVRIILAEVMSIDRLSTIEQLALLDVLLEAIAPDALAALGITLKPGDLRATAHAHGLTEREFVGRIARVWQLAEFVIRTQDMPDMIDQMEAVASGLDRFTVQAILRVSATAVLCRSHRDWPHIDAADSIGLAP